MYYLEKSFATAQDISRQEDAEDIRRAFYGLTQKEMAKKAAETLEVSESAIINYLHCRNDMKSRTIKALHRYLATVEAVASKIEGSE